MSLISIQELTFLATEVYIHNDQGFKTWIIVGAMWFILCYSFALFGHLERRACGPADKRHRDDEHSSSQYLRDPDCI